MHNRVSSNMYLPSSMIPLHDFLRKEVPSIPVTKILIIMNFLVFLAMLASGANLWHSSNGIQLAWGANFGPAVQDGEWWRLGSALFLHFGVVHLALNLIALWDSGQLVERMYGHVRFAIIYFTSGLVGNLLSLATREGATVSGGASGAIFGIYGALLIFLWRERGNLQRHEFRWLFWGATGFSIITIILGFSVTGIDNAAHIGGFVSGIMSGLILAKSGITKCVSTRGRLFSGGTFILLIIVLIGQIPEPSYRWSEEVLVRREINNFLRDDVEIRHAWQDILDEGKRGDISFDEIAGRIDTAIGDRYEESFEQLSRLPANPALPSAVAMETLRHYVERRRDFSRALASGLRAGKPAETMDALEKNEDFRQMDSTR
jgi:rhomboid protease GluP